MSLFDVIKYPISMPPTEAELSRLPLMIYMRWIRESDWNQYIHAHNVYRASNVASWYATHYGGPGCKAGDYADLAHLRKIIEQWDEVTDELV